MNYRAVLIAVGLVSGCATTSDLGDMPYDDAYDQVLEDCERGDFTELTASYVLADDGGWHFQPCDECESRSMALYWAGNTSLQQQGFLLIVEDLDRINDMLGLEGEIPLLTFEQYTQSVASCFYLGDAR
ncbi:MAG: hypothetical protein OXT72_10470 [Gammaproteobacteria bacterium]|nr:hypothetical protein [Gammaproteobacteria bacterium]